MVRLVRERGLPQGVTIRPKGEHLDRMRESGHFRSTREVLLHHVEEGDAARFLEMTRSNAFSGLFTDQETGFDRLSGAAYQYIGPQPIPWYISYRVRIAIK